MSWFYIYRVLSRSYFHLPVLWVWFVVEQGIDIWVTAILLALYSGTLTFGAPLAHRLQRRLPPGRSITVGELTKAVGLLLVVLAGDGVALIVLGQLVGGLGYSLGQGPDSLLLRSLYSDDDAETYATHESRSMSWVFAAVFVAGVAGGFLYNAEPASPFAASIAVSLLASVAAQRLARSAPGNQVEDASAPTDGGARPTVALTAHELRWSAYYALVRGLAVAAFVVLLPMLFFVELGLQVSLFGLVLGSFGVMAYLSGRYGTRLLQRAPSGLVRPVSIAALGGVFALFAVADSLPVALVGMAALGSVNGVVRPMAMSQLNSVPGRTRSERGRVIAFMERLYGATNAAALILGGVVAGATSVTTALGTFSALAVVLGLAGLQLGRKRPADDLQARGM